MRDTLLSYFQAKQRGHERETAYDTQCPFCSMQCKLQLIEQQTSYRCTYMTKGIDNPTTNGRACIKGLHAHQHSFHHERLLHPLIKRDGQFIQASWEEVYTLIGERLAALQEDKGKDAVAVYGSASLTNEAAYLLGKFARVALQTRFIDYNGRLCMSAAASAANQTFGMDRGFTNPILDLEHTRCLMLVGTNLAECQPTMMTYVEKAKQNGAFVIVIDPRMTSTARLADLHLQLKPGTDVALVNGMLKIIIEENLVDHEFIKRRVHGFEEVKEHMSTVDLQQISLLTGVPLDKITRAARIFAKEETGMLLTARGVEQQTDGAMAVRNLLNILLVTGKIGKFASGFGAITGQGNGQGAREHGQKADQLPGYRSIEKLEDRITVAERWKINEKELPRKGVSAFEMFEKMEQGEIKGLFLMCSNPVVSLPASELVQSAIKKLSFFVAVDLFMSETAALADVILPATSYLENEGTMTNVEGRVTLREASYPIRGEAKHDWQILCELANRIGKGERFAFSTVEEIFDELKELSRGGIADYSGMSYARIRSNEGLLWPCPSEAHEGTVRLFTESFAHPDGKARMAVVPNQSLVPKDSISQDYPLLLTSGRVLAHYLTGVQTRKSAGLAARNIESFVEIHPTTAKKYHIADGALVTIQSAQGEVVVRGKWSEQIREDTLFVPIHWSGIQNVNILVHSKLDPYCQMPGFKVVAVRIVQGS